MAWIRCIGNNGGGGGGVQTATGSFVSGSERYAKVEVNCGFQPDYIEVAMDFGNNTHTCANYFKTSNGYETSRWDLRPMEGAVYDIALGSTEGETGISDITSSGFKYRCNAPNTQNAQCTYLAVKF